VARITLAVVYETPLEEDVDAAVFTRAFRLFNEEAEEVSRHPDTKVRITFRIRRLTPEGRLLWSVSEEVDTEILQRWDAEHASRAIASAAERFEDVAGTVISRSKMDILTHSLAMAMRKSLRVGNPLEATVRVPLRHADREFIGANPMAFVEIALERPFPFAADLRRQTSGMTAEVKGSHLVISGASPPAVGLAAAAFVRAPRPIIRAIPTHPIWAYGTLTILAVSFALSWFPLSTDGVVALGASALATTALTLLLGHRRGLIRRTAIGLVPVLIVIAFALVYSVAGLTGETLELQGQALYLRDPLLLSLSLASTVGMLDLTVSGWLRSVAYLEMLLVASYLGAAVMVTVRSLSVRLDQTIRELRSERERD
jgi:hypothetical protein